MRKITSLAHAVYCPGQRSLTASDSSGAAVQGVLLPPGVAFSRGGGLKMLSSVVLQKIETIRKGVQGVAF
jgi:hypothetical protein